MNTRKIGSEGEEQASQYLLLRGYEIIRRNYGIQIGEVDLIARSPEGVIVFVEVKFVQTLSYGDPSWKISQKKRATIGRVAEIFLQEHHLTGTPFRIDAITITPAKTEHYINCL